MCPRKFRVPKPPKLKRTFWTRWNRKKGTTTLVQRRKRPI